MSRKNFIPVLFLIFFAYLSFLDVFSVELNCKSYKVLKVIDGDTVFIDYNNNGKADKNEKSRINVIDTFEIKDTEFLKYQKDTYNLDTNEALYLCFLVRKFAQDKLLGKNVYACHSAETEKDIYNRHLVSIKYGNKSYEKEVLKQVLQ